MPKNNHSARRIPVLDAPFAPTPIEHLFNDDAGNAVDVKRDDLIPFSFGGNKARKAAEFYREILDRNPDLIMTYGSNSSNHCRIIANMACAMGLPCHIISPDERVEGKDGRELFNAILVKRFGATVETVPVNEVADTIEQRIREFSENGQTAYFIQGGGHGNLGTEAYVKAWREIRAQEKAQGFTYDYIFHASGTGTTQAGLLCGLLTEAPGTPRPDIIGISIARPLPRGGEVVEDSARAWFAEHGGTWQPDVLHFLDDYRCGGYGLYDARIENTISDVMNKYGLPLDTTYTGKAFTGMLRYLEEHGISGKRILFLHTGGTPLYFDRL